VVGWFVWNPTSRPNLICEPLQILTFLWIPRNFLEISCKNSHFWKVHIKSFQKSMWSGMLAYEKNEEKLKIVGWTKKKHCAMHAINVHKNGRMRTFLANALLPANLYEQSKEIRSFLRIYSALGVTSVLFCVGTFCTPELCFRCDFGCSKCVINSRKNTSTYDRYWRSWPELLKQHKVVLMDALLTYIWS